MYIKSLNQLSQTRVLVTNAVTYLPKMDLIVVLKDGEISETGTFEQLLSNNGAFSEFLALYTTSQAEQEDEIDEEG